MQGNAYYQVPAVTIAASRKIDTRGAAEYLAATLNNQQPGPCSSDRSGGSTSASSIRPAFCSELPQMPVMCGTATYTYKDAPVGCSSAGASFNILFMNPNDKCEKGNPPPEEIGLSLDFWWRQQLDWLSNGKLHNATTVLPGEATSVNVSNSLLAGLLPASSTLLSFSVPPQPPLATAAVEACGSSTPPADCGSRG